MDDPLDSGLGGELGEARMAAPLTGVTTAASLSGLLRRIEGLGEPGTVLSASERVELVSMAQIKGRDVS